MAFPIANFLSMTYSASSTIPPTIHSALFPTSLASGSLIFPASRSWNGTRGTLSFVLGRSCMSRNPAPGRARPNPCELEWDRQLLTSVILYYTAKIRPYCRISQRTQPVPKYVVPLLRHFDKLVRESQECFVPAPCASTAGRSIIGTHSFTLRAFYFLCYSY
jgi:hypothetical protein